MRQFVRAGRGSTICSVDLTGGGSRGTHYYSSEMLALARQDCIGQLDPRTQFLGAVLTVRIKFLLQRQHVDKSGADR